MQQHGIDVIMRTMFAQGFKGDADGSLRREQSAFSQPILDRMGEGHALEWSEHCLDAGHLAAALSLDCSCKRTQLGRMVSSCGRSGTQYEHSVEIPSKIHENIVALNNIQP